MAARRELATSLCRLSGEHMFVASVLARHDVVGRGLRSETRLMSLRGMTRVLQTRSPIKLPSRNELSDAIL
jgi:hypothetical protein